MLMSKKVLAIVDQSNILGLLFYTTQELNFECNNHRVDDIVYFLTTFHIQTISNIRKPSGILMDIVKVQMHHLHAVVK